MRVSEIQYRILVMMMMMVVVVLALTCVTSTARVLYSNCDQSIYMSKAFGGKKKKEKEKEKRSKSTAISSIYSIIVGVLASQTSSLPSFLLQEGEGGKCFW